MRKTKNRIRDVAQIYADEMRRRFPDLEYEIIPERWYGADAWVRLGVSAEEVEAATEASVQVKFDLYDRTGVSIIATVSEHRYFAEVA
ncbi:MAG: hypothetical protein M1370_05275 [Bacteroidetes bacterium]|nr:hypothetical protein [Bacteroidota bacterium]MCL5027144.1 hypothetical protein [Chloroflexota bacterium]